MNDYIHALLVAHDACAERRYSDARRILADIPLVVIRTFSAGVHFGRLVFTLDKRAALEDARRIWSWTGAHTLNEVSQNGIESGRVSKPVPVVILTEVIEILPCSPEAIASIGGCGW